MRNHNLPDFRTSTLLKEKSSDHFKDLDRFKLLTNFDVNLTSFLGGLINCVLNVYFYFLLVMTAD